MENEIMIGNTVDRGVHLQPPYEPPLSFYFCLSDPIESLTTPSWYLFSFLRGSSLPTTRADDVGFLSLPFLMPTSFRYFCAVLLLFLLPTSVWKFFIHCLQ